MRSVKRGLLATEARTRATAVQRIAADDFGELPGRKRAARQQAERLGHVLGPWHRRPNDQFGRWHAFCAQCAKLAVVATEPPDQIGQLIYGPVVSDRCGKGR